MPVFWRIQSMGITKSWTQLSDFHFHFHHELFSSVVQSRSTLCDPWTAAHQTSLSITKSKSLLRLMFIESMMPSNHLIVWHPLLLLPSIIPSIRFFSNELALCIRWPKLGGQKFWSFSINPCNEYSGLVSFRIDWFDLLEVQGLLNSLLQHHSLKASILPCSAFFYGPTFTSIHDYWKSHKFD